MLSEEHKEVFRRKKLLNFMFFNLTENEPNMASVCTFVTKRYDTMTNECNLGTFLFFCIDVEKLNKMFIFDV